MTESTEPAGRVNGEGGSSGNGSSLGGAPASDAGPGGLSASGGTSGATSTAGSSGATGAASGSSGTTGGGDDAGASGGAGASGTGGGLAGIGGAVGVAGSSAGFAGSSAGQGGMGNAGSGGKAGGSNGGAGAGGGAGGATGLPATTLWIAGDSTVKTYPANNTDGNNGATLEGWGQELGSFFTSKVTINNQAVGGRSVAFFMWTVVTDSAGAYQCDSQGAPMFKLTNGNKVDTSQWARIQSGIKAGDFLLIQFGHNDETHTCPRFVSIADFETDLGFMADTVRAKGATPIFVTPMGHRTFSGTRFNNTLLPYANAMKTEAATKTVDVIDLNLRSGEYYESVGNTYLATNIFDGGTTHFIRAGAVEMATLIVGELKRTNGPLAAYLK